MRTHGMLVSKEDFTMTKAKKKNPAAQSMAKVRWSKVSKKDRSAIMRKTAQARWQKGASK
jgi:hypothetical protein